MAKITNAVLAERIEGLQKFLDQQHDESTRRLEEIQRQTTKTNGRVTRLERWQTAIIAGAAVVLFLLRDSLIQIIQKLF